jgi:hypothetical protein
MHFFKKYTKYIYGITKLAKWNYKELIEPKHSIQAPKLTIEHHPPS